MTRRLGVLLAPVCVCALLAACGGGGGGASYNSTGGNGNSAPPPAALTITTNSLPKGIVGKSYSGQFQATGGTAPYTWSAPTPLPSWLTLDPKTGTVSGTAPISNLVYQGNFFYIDITVTDSSTPAQSVTKRAILLELNGLLALAGSAPGGTRGIPYSLQDWVLGGQGPYTISVDSGMPPGLNMVKSTSNTSFFTIEGTPTAAGSFTTQIRVKDSGSPAQEAVLPLTFSFDATFTVTTHNLKPGVVGRNYSDQLVAVNGTSPLTWSAQNLTAGLTLDASTGAISGVPTSAGGTTYIVTAKDSSSPPQSATGYANVTIYDALAFSTAGPLQGNVRSQFSQQLVNYGGLPPVSVQVTSGSLPPGVTLSSQFRNLSGTPSQAGTYAFTVTATDSDTPPVSIQHSYTFTVFTPLPVLSTLALPTGVIGKPYSAKLWARDGMPPYTWAVDSGTLPPGVTLNADGSMTGTPTTLPSSGAAFQFVASATDSASPAQTTKGPYSITVTATPKGRNDSIATATPASYPGLNASFSPYSDPPDSTTSAPDTDYYRVIGNAGDTITISASASGQTDPAIEIVDANGQRYKTCKDPGDDNPTLTFIVKDTTPTAFDDECLNDDIDPTVDRNARLDFQVPGAAGTQLTFYVHAFDSSGNARPDMTYRLDLSSNVVRPLTATAMPATSATVGAAFSYQVQFLATGGTTPYTWQFDSGSLPPGLQLVNIPINGWMIQGTPTTAGSYTFTLKVSDAGNPPQTGTIPFTINVK